MVTFILVCYGVFIKVRAALSSDIRHLADGSIVVTGKLPDGTYFQETLIQNETSSKSVLLLHGAAFSTETWNAIGTVDMITSLGVPSVAIGKSLNIFLLVQ